MAREAKTRGLDLPGWGKLGLGMWEQPGIGFLRNREMQYKSYQKIDQSPMKGQIRCRQHWPKSESSWRPQPTQARVLLIRPMHANRILGQKGERLGTSTGTWAQGPASAMPSMLLSQPAPGCMSVPSSRLLSCSPKPLPHASHSTEPCALVSPP